MISIPGYDIQRELGHGGMASVYLAIQHSLEREVAIKVLSEDLVSDPEFCQRFLKEGKILARVPHPNVVTIFDSGEHEGIYYMCMEFMPGGTLEDRLNRGALPPSESIQILKQVASALQWSHSKGMIHRDVKPANVLFREDGNPVLSDFGIAKTLRRDTTQMTQAGMAIGTPTYMSPEQASAQELTPKADQYSLGVMFYEMLAGQVPYSADSAIAVAVQHVQAPIPSLPGGLEHLQPIIDRVMAKDPEERFPSMEDLIESVHKASAGTPSNLKTTVIRPRGKVEPTQSQPVYRHPFALASMGVIAGAIVLGALYWATVKPTNEEANNITNATETTASPAIVATGKNEQEIKKWLDVGETHFSIGRLVEPPNNNALEAYWKVLEFDPTNADAIRGLKNIAVSLETLARASLEGGDIDETKVLVNQGLMADPQNKELAELQRQLASQ